MRDVRGKPVAPDKDEKVKATSVGKEAGDQPKDPGAIQKVLAEHDKKLGEHDSQFSAHHNRISSLESIMGLAKGADEMRSQDQGGKRGNPGKGHDTEKHPARQRH